MSEVKIEECCLENKQLTAASSSSISEGSGSAILKSPGVSSPATASPTHRSLPLNLLYLFFIFPQQAVITNLYAYLLPNLLPLSHNFCPLYFFIHMKKNKFFLLSFQLYPS